MIHVFYFFSISWDLRLSLETCIPSGCLFDVAIITTPCSNSAVNNLLSIIASAMSVTCKKKNKKDAIKVNNVAYSKKHQVTPI